MKPTGEKDETMRDLRELKLGGEAGGGTVLIEDGAPIPAEVLDRAYETMIGRRQSSIDLAEVWKTLDGDRHVPAEALNEVRALLAGDHLCESELRRLLAQHGG